MKNLALTITAVFFFLGSAIAQDNAEAKHDVSINIPTVAILDVEDVNGEASSISLTPDISSLEAGEAVSFKEATDNSLWLNYTSVVGENKTRSVGAKLSSGANSLPTGVTLVLSVASAQNGNGDLGTAASSDLTLGSSEKSIVTNIGSCYTETGASNGHNLTYKLNVDNDKFKNLVAKNYTVEVTYTITDN